MKQLVIIILFLPLLIKAQSFHGGAFILEAQTGLEVYQAKKTYVSNLGLNDTSVTDQAASGSAAAAIEIGLSKRWGIGVRGKMNTFFSDLDGVMRQETAMKTVDMILSVSLHPIVRKHLDISLGMEGGISNADVRFQNLSSVLTSGMGTYSGLFFEPRFYKKRLGFNMRFSLPVSRYRDLNTVGLEISKQNFALNTWTGRGFGLSVGVQLRIL